MLSTLFCHKSRISLLFTQSCFSTKCLGINGLTLIYLRHGESYSGQNVNCCVHNVIVGKLWVEHYGVMEIVNHKTKHKAVLNFKQGGWFGKDLHKVEGFIYDPSKRKAKSLYGSWLLDLFGVDSNAYEEHLQNIPVEASSKHSVNGETKSKSDDIEDNIPSHHLSLSDLNIPGQVLLWKATPRPENSHLMQQQKRKIDWKKNREQLERRERNIRMNGHQYGFDLVLTPSHRKKTGCSQESTGVETGQNVQKSFDL